MFQGSIVALVTPMLSTGELDEENLRLLIEKHIAAGTDAIVLAGTTGEAPTLTHTEKQKLTKIGVEVAKECIPIIVGTGSYSTMDTCYQTEQAMDLGADACLITVPYYNRPTQEGLYQHFRAVAEVAPIPIILYNHPGRTGCDLLPETTNRLADIPNIIGLKDATGDLARCRELMALCGDRIDLFSGVDDSALAFMLQGGKGVISVTSNVAPKAMTEMCAAALSGDVGLAGKINTRLMPLHKTLSLESNPIPVKWVLQQMGWIQNGIRLPLTPLSEQHYEALREAMKISEVI
jgi:4-hydroxy-tetrahydrodipicolinate synthase